MDSFKTPTQKQFSVPKPLSASKTGKRPVNLNSTVSTLGSGHKKYTPGNQTFRRNLDVTIAGRTSAAPKFKSNLLTQKNNIDYELECDLTYGEYLQALMKKNITEKVVENHKILLEDQLLIQYENQNRLKKTYSDLLNNTKQLQKRSEVVEIMNFLEENVEEFKKLCEKYDIKNHINILQEILIVKCDTVSLKNVKPLKNQEEYDKLLQILRKIVATTEKIVNSGRNFEETHALAEDMTNLLQLKSDVEESQKQLVLLQQEATFTLLQSASDMFAKQGGYG